MAARVLQWICRLALAGVFLLAGFSKVYPAGRAFSFEMTLSTYQLLPVWGVIVVARTLPWLEMGLALVLLLGWKPRYVVTFTALLLTLFMAAMGITYARGIEANCGCFGLGEPISPATLARDSVFLLMAIYLAAVAWQRPPAAAAAA
ncbi:MAG: DoxX family protein [Acidobacteria bacterium]|nr:DoxX family protein [Acidobacteriota bacterium]